jgi:hypothetical protein
MNCLEIFDIFKKHNSAKYGEFRNIYSKIFSELSQKKEKIIVLEIGQRRGETFKCLLDIFPNSIIYGLDIGIDEYKNGDVKNMLENYGGDRAKLYVGDQKNIELLNKIGTDVMNNYNGFDLIIDDGGHKMEQQQISLKTLSNYMKPYGKYIIEDIETSYYSSFGGGEIGKKNTTIDLLKNLIDVINRDFTRGYYKHLNRPRRDVVKYSKFINDDKIFSLEIFPNCAILNFGYYHLYK